MIKVLIADDSPLIRLLLTNMLEEHSDIKVIDTASNGEELVYKALQLQPDVILTDLLMSPYDGLYAIERLVPLDRFPIIVLSSLNRLNDEIALSAVNYGIFGFINKPDSNIKGGLRVVLPEILQAIRSAIGEKIKYKHFSSKGINASHTFPKKIHYRLVVVGASTGGTSAIEAILTQLPVNFPIPIIIAQHIHPKFVSSFANRLSSILPFCVKVPSDGEEVNETTFYLLPTHCNTILTQSQGVLRFQTTHQQFSAYNNPSIDALFQSAAELFGNQIIGILLTGMGKDGAQGLLTIYQKGGFTIAQDEKSSVIFGMPKAAIEMNAVHNVLSIEEIPIFLVSLLDSENHFVKNC
ncbi:MAG: chemotaxis-specific protein-glutamate methyltransferase CheB [Cytophagales bacterium]|nr:chemotaxis-specific protein-glutamate methyltransferase CheB [Cytophagales bacterium]MDW8383182.1 chemotaxis-specific protein-glutamate methyltransferase CheB [Flammeovirgaceae bacterium]